MDETVTKRFFPGLGRGKRRAAAGQTTVEDASFESLSRGYSDKLGHANRQLAKQVSANVILAMVCMVMAAAVFYLLLFREPESYVLEVDPTTNTVRYGGLLSDTRTLGSEYVPPQLMLFIERWRTVTPDNAMQKSYIKRLYCMVPDQSLTRDKLNRYFREQGNDPFKRNTTVSVSTKISQISKLSANTYQVDWYETTREHTGRVLEEAVRQRATMIVQRDKTSGECKEGNPIGAYVMDINWTEVQ